MLFNYSGLYLSDCFYSFAVNAFLMFLNCLVLTDLAWNSAGTICGELPNSG